VPRITAPTVAEHRARRLHDLLQAARELVSEQGPDALTLGALAQQVGLSRSSLYEYFRSRDDVVAAIVEDEIPSWAEEIAAEMARSPDVAGKVSTYVRVQLRMLTDGRHTAAMALSAHALGEHGRERIRHEHSRLLEPLVSALTEAEIPDAELRAHFIQGVVHAAAPLIDPADTPRNERVTGAAADQAVSGLPAR
jgi:AcrR family transcriptional regulator